ncbi:MAG TPA: virulence-associated E family protein [Polyangiaceae bacterium]|nr:virulence-associated E family protein [Polyangiaceae bacterium]
MMSSAVVEVARQCAYHPVRDFLRGLVWDGRPRLDSMLVEMFGAENTDVVRTIAAKWMISAVARVFQPGCQVDHMMVLEGPQGTRKSTALRTLVGDDWFRNSPVDLRGKDAPMALRGCWVYEFDELDSFRGREATRVKSFLSQRVDSYRPAYGRAVVDLPRECVFVGTTNEHQYLADPTGNRRFWPVRCGAIDIPALAAARAQLWAEAYARYAAGEIWHIDSADLGARLRDQQADREELDPWVEVIRRWFDRLPSAKQAEGITTHDVMAGALEIKPGVSTRRDETRVGHALKSLGLIRQREMRNGNRVYRYYPSEMPSAPPMADCREQGEATCG